MWLPEEAHTEQDLCFSDVREKAYSTLIPVDYLCSCNFPLIVND